MSLYPETIESVQLYVLGDEENQQDSYVEVKHKDLFRQAIPIPNGVYDTHMGTTDKKLRCLTCFNIKRDCPGHEGHINLNYPVQSPMYKDDIIRWLKIVCFKCGELLVDKLDEIEHVPIRKKLGEYTKLARNAKKTSCDKCGEPHPSVSRDDNRPVTIWAEIYKDGVLERRYQLFNHVIAKIFERISYKTITTLGKTMESHPRKFIISVLRVPPNTVRPDIKKIGGGRSNNNDLTTLTKAIVEINNMLPAIIPDDITDVFEIGYANLNMAYYELVKGTPPTSGKNKVMMNTNKPPTSIASRFPQKSGRIRQHLMGSRTWKTARSVITCDPMMHITEIGIPQEVAQSIQIPEVVNTDSYNRLMIYLSNKRDAYPGCTKVLKKSTGQYHWVGSKQGIVLEEGDVVERDLIDGDVMMFNRQPSMLGPSLTCHKIRILTTGKSFRMNISACVLYNADFDGDAMNIMFASSMQVRNEISNLGHAGVNFMSKATGGPLLGCFQDTLASVVEMTHNDVRINKYNAMELFKNMKATFDKQAYTGRELISKLLPPINFSTVGLFYNKAYAPYLKYNHDEIKVVIERGELKQGIMDHKSCGQERNKSIFHVIHNEYGPTIALDTLFNIQQVVMEFIYSKGFTVSMNDITVTEETLAAIQDKTSALIMEAERITDKLKAGKIIPPIGLTVAEFYEQQQVNALALGDDFVEPVLSNIDTTNNGLYKMIQMCKKGKMKNFQSITSAMGSSLINGSRAATTFGFARTLPFFPRFDTSPISNGFVPNSFITGISPKSFLFTAQEARFGVINKALSTSVSGKQGRESVKNLESIVANNLRQCTKHHSIVQFVYGGNGVDTRRLESVKMLTVSMSDAELSKEFEADVSMFAKAYHNDGFRQLLKDEFAAIVEDRELYRSNFLNVETTFADKMFDDTMLLPVNVDRVVRDIIYDFRESKQPVIDPVAAIEAVRKFCDKYPYIFSNSIQERKGTSIPARFSHATRMTTMLVRAHLCIKRLMKNNISFKMLELILEKIRFTAQKSLIEYGTAVGALAALSNSEPMTQYIIDSHHRSGVTGGAADTQTDKITRNNEILLAKISERMKNPTMMLYVLPEYEDDSMKVNEIANHIESIRMYRFLSKLQVFFEEYGSPVHPDYVAEAKLIKDFENHNPNIKYPTDLTKWVIRMELNRLKMILKNMDMDTIVYVLSNTYPDVFFVYSTESDDNIVMRGYIRSSLKKNQTITQKDAQSMASTITNTIIRGVKNILSATVIKKKKTYIDKDGSTKSKPIYAIRTNGTNMRAILDNQYLDVTKCQTDSIQEVREVFGIEAARHKLRAELESLMSGMCQAHYSLFADEMTVTGVVTEISKTGLEKREGRNILLRTSYNFMTQVLKSAAVNNRKSKIYGMSAPLMVGRSPYVGSCYNAVTVDHDFIKSNVESLDDIIDDL